MMHAWRMRKSGAGVISCQPVVSEVLSSNRVTVSPMRERRGRRNNEDRIAFWHGHLEGGLTMKRVLFTASVVVLNLQRGLSILN